MEKFNKISDVGRGRLLFKTHTNGLLEELFLATTNEFILRRKGEEIILPSQERAIEWAISSGVCSNKRAFMERCVNAVRIPYGNVIPQLRLYFDSPDKTKHLRIDPDLRMTELIQHPIYNHCIIRYDDSEQLITLNNAQRHGIISLVRLIFEADYYCGDQIQLADGLHLTYNNNELYVQMFEIAGFFQSYGIECFTVFTGANLPIDFINRNVDEATWVRIVDTSESLNMEMVQKLAMIAIAVCLHYQINYEFAYAPAENPLTVLQDLGLLPYEPHPDLYY